MADLDALVKACGNHLNTGFLTTPHLCEVLADNGYAETAYHILLQEEAPGWLYEVRKGATTVWETWDGINEAGVPKDSLNHYSYGAIAGWLIEGGGRYPLYREKNRDTPDHIRTARACKGRVQFAERKNHKRMEAGRGQSSSFHHHPV